MGKCVFLLHSYDVCLLGSAKKQFVSFRVFTSGKNEPSAKQGQMVCSGNLFSLSVYSGYVLLGNSAIYAGLNLVRGWGE